MNNIHSYETHSRAYSITKGLVFNTGLWKQGTFTVGHQQVGKYGDTSQDEGSTLGGPAPKHTHGHRDDDFGWDVHSAEDDLNQVHVHSKLLQVHGKPIIAKAGREPLRNEGSFC